MIFGFFLVPLTDLYAQYQLRVLLGAVVFVLVTAPIIYEVCERYPFSVNVTDCLRHLFRRGFFL